jgi:phosphate transport system substrate-binding protein
MPPVSFEMAQLAVARRWRWAALAAVLGLLLGACGGQDATAPTPRQDTPVISGAGATFPAPIYQRWLEDFAKRDDGDRVHYDAVGSGEGVDRFIAGEVDFGATDFPMTDEELKKAEANGGGILHVPTVLGAIVVAYNLPGVDRPLRFDARVVGDIFLGKVASWDDPAIKQHNPGVALPSARIVTAHRSDGSGTTQNFTTYLAKRNPEFAERIGAGKEAKWVGGLAGEGNGGVAEQLVKHQYSLGYVELNYAIENNLQYGSMQNRAGRFVLPTVASTSAAATDLSGVPDDFRATLIDSWSEDAYPVATWTFIIVRQRQPDPVKGRTLARMLWYMVHTGQPLAKDLAYAPLPERLVPEIEFRLFSVKGPSGDYAGS